MTSEVKRVPELRFPEFSGEWEEDKLRDLLEDNVILEQSDGNHGELYPKSSEFTEDGIPYLAASNISNNSISYQNIKYLPLERAKQFKKGVARDGDILLAHNATVGPSTLLITDFPFVILSTTLTLYRINKVKMDNHFFLNEIRSNNVQNQLKKLMKQTTRNQVPILLQRTMHISYPKILAEQHKIGSFFSKLDRQIELEEQKLEKLEEQKKGYMQEIFSQNLRFKDENGNSYPDWSIKKIEDISKVNKGFTPNTKNDEYWDESNENWLSIAGMTQKYLYKGNKGITEKGASKHVKVDKDTLIMSFKLTLGKLAIVKELIYTNEAICHFIWKENNVNTEYMYYYLNSINISTFGAQAVKGVTLNNDSINSIIVKLPVIQEQNKISNFFTKFDELIEKQNQKIDGLKKRKKGFLQKMFV